MPEKFLYPSSDIMSALFATVTDGIVVSDKNGKIIFGNDAALRINDDEHLPSDPQERIQHYTSRFENSERPLTLEELPSQRAFCEGVVINQEVILTSAKGQKKILICNGRALYNLEGEKIGSVLVFHDKTLENAIENKKSDLEKERSHLLRMNAELERFSSIAAHDLKSPLNSITQFAELLDEEYGDKLGPEGSQWLQVIINSGNRLRALIDDLLSYARAGKDLGVLTSFDSRILVDEILGSLRGTILNTNASIDVNPLPTIVADRIGLSQVFQNIISNSLKYRGENPPKIKINAIDDNECWRFQIQDNGVGFQEEDQKSAFDLFIRFEQSHKIEGTGLGLPICKRIIEFHGGSIGLTSVKGRGTTFYFTLPKTIKPS